MIATVICQVCREKIATIDTDVIATPTDGSMFYSPDARHGFKPPWELSADVTWRFYRCPYGPHRPFNAEDQILTEELGLISIPTKEDRDRERKERERAEAEHVEAEQQESADSPVEQQQADTNEKRRGRHARRQ